LIGATRAVVANREAEPFVPLRDGDAHYRRVRVPGRVGERLRDDVIRRHLDWLREPRDRGNIELDLDRGPAGQRPQGRPEPAFGQDRRVDAACDLSADPRRRR
jgi:hypothetical protein